MTYLCRHRGEAELQCQLIRNLALEGGGWAAPRPGRFVARPGTHYRGDWVGIGTVLDGHVKSHVHRDLIPDRPSRSESLYRLRHLRRSAIYMYIYIFFMISCFRRDAYETCALLEF